MNPDGDDGALVARFLATREEAAFRALYRRHTPFLYRFLIGWTAGGEAAAQEGVQETWIRAVEALPGFAWRSSLRTWLCGISIRWWREDARRRRKDAGPPAEEAAAAPIGREIDRIDLERAVAALPDGYREVLLLHDVEGYTHDEAAQLLGIDAGTSKSQLSRARRAMRVLLTGGPHG
jgi:RNA polymerase sigma-70 factor (ECF subfamily)